MIDWEVGWIGWLFGFFFVCTAIYCFTPYHSEEVDHLEHPGFLNTMQKMWKLQRSATQLRLIFGNINFFYGMYAPLELPWGGTALTPPQVFGVNCLLYSFPIFLVNVLPLLVKLCKCCCAPGGACCCPGRRSERDGPGAGRKDPNASQKRLREGRLKRDRDGYYVEIGTERPVRLQATPYNARDGDWVAVDVNYAMEAQSAVVVEGYGTGGGFCCNCCDKFWTEVFLGENWVRPLEVWTALYALKFLPKRMCNPFVLSDYERTDFLWTYWVDIAEFAITFVDVGFIAISAKLAVEAQEDRWKRENRRYDQGQGAFVQLPAFDQPSSPRQTASPFASAQSPFSSASSAAPNGSLASRFSAWFN